jgi:hypothetical protein
MMRLELQVSKMASVLLLLLMCGVSGGGIDTITGDERGLWTEGHISVIVARVTAMEEFFGRDAPASYRATLEPIALIAGSFDPSEHPTPRASFVAGPAAAMVIHDPPPKGALVLVVLRDADWIYSDTCLFMPDRVPITILTGLDDKRIAQTLKRIQDAREKARAEEKQK